MGKNHPHRNRVPKQVKGKPSLMMTKRMIDSKLQNFRYETMPKEVAIEKLNEIDELLELFWVIRGR